MAIWAAVSTIAILVGYCLFSEYRLLSITDCDMAWWSRGLIQRAAKACWQTTFGVLIGQGIRKRAGPRWMAATSMIAFPVFLYEKVWVMDCTPQVEKVAYLAMTAVLFPFCLHHLLSRRAASV
jgi:hypothetical protein